MRIYRQSNIVTFAINSFVGSHEITFNDLPEIVVHEPYPCFIFLMEGFFAVNSFN